MNQFYELDENLYNSLEEIDRQTSEKLQLKKEVEKFFESQIGKYILSRIEAESDAAIQKMIVSDPTDAKAITQYQNDIRTVNNIKNWLIDAIEEGLVIEENLRNKF
jgi:L-lysine 2,3-aminomutase